MAHSTTAVIAARKNHAPHLIPVRKSPIGLPLQPHALTISLSIIVPFVAQTTPTEIIFLAATRGPLNAIIDWEMTTPTSSSICRGWGTEVRGRALAGRTGPEFIAYMSSRNPDK